jgi:hypothetical protein
MIQLKLKYVDEPVTFEYLTGKYCTFEDCIVLQIRFKMRIYGVSNILQMNAFIMSPVINDKDIQVEVIDNNISMSSRIKDDYYINEIIETHGKKNVFDIFKEAIFDLLEPELERIELAPYRFTLLPI